MALYVCPGCYANLDPCEVCIDCSEQEKAAPSVCGTGSGDMGNKLATTIARDGGGVNG